MSWNSKRVKHHTCCKTNLWTHQWVQKPSSTLSVTSLECTLPGKWITTFPKQLNRQWRHIMKTLAGFPIHLRVFGLWPVERLNIRCSHKAIQNGTALLLIMNCIRIGQYSFDKNHLFLNRLDEVYLIIYITGSVGFYTQRQIINC